MGRCYEFGVAITAGCEHAMVVTPQGGACECRTCAAHCPGRFAGCVDVIAQPGFVPSTAPRWAVEIGEPPEPVPADARESPPPEPTPAVQPPPTETAVVATPDAAIIPEVAQSMGVAEALLIAVQAELDAMRTLLHAVLDRPVPAGRDETVEAFAALRAEIERRDAQMTRAFDRLHAHLTAIEEDLP